MKKFLFSAVAVLMGMAVLIGVNDAQEKKAKYTNKEVMAKAMKGGLCKKVASGKATAEEKAELVELFVALQQNTPKKGDADSWKVKTEALIVAVKGDDGKALAAAANCAACHKAHK